MALCLLLANFQNVIVQCGKESLIRSRTVNQRVSRRVDQTILVWGEYFECRRKVVRKN